jgi:hypothetical protein
MKLTAGRVHLELDLPGIGVTVAALLAVILWRKGVVEVLTSAAHRLAPPSPPSPAS